MQNLSNLDIEILRVLIPARHAYSKVMTGFGVYCHVLDRRPELQERKGKRKVHRRIAMLQKHGLIINTSDGENHHQLRITQFGREQLAMVDPPTLEVFFDKDLIQ